MYSIHQSDFLIVDLENLIIYLELSLIVLKTQIPLYRNVKTRKLRMFSEDVTRTRNYSGKQGQPSMI